MRKGLMEPLGPEIVDRASRLVLPPVAGFGEPTPIDVMPPPPPRDTIAVEAGEAPASTFFS